MVRIDILDLLVLKSILLIEGYDNLSLFPYKVQEFRIVDICLLWLVLYQEVTECLGVTLLENQFIYKIVLFL